MAKATARVGLLAILALAGVRCGPGADGPLSIDERSADRFSGRWVSPDARAVEFESTRSGPLAGAVSIGVGALTYDVHYDFEAREVVADGHDGALDRPTQRLLRDAGDDVARFLASPGDPESEPRAAGDPLIEPMLYASLVLLADSGGMPLSRQVFRLGSTLAPAEVDKSLGNDGVTCIERDSTYAVSFDHLDGTTLDAPVTAGAEDCNGRCGPGCTPLTPWAMWTLDCLEHDTCCDATGDGVTCWTPLGECGDEYVHAETDFLRGFDPLSPHCGG